MVLLLKIKRRDFFNETEFLFWCHALWKHCWNCCIFEMKLGTGMEPCTKIYFLFTFNPVNIRIRKTSLFWLCNLMTSLWKPSIRGLKYRYVATSSSSIRKRPRRRKIRRKGRGRKTWLIITSAKRVIDPSPVAFFTTHPSESSLKKEALFSAGEGADLTITASWSTRGWSHSTVSRRNKCPTVNNCVTKVQKKLGTKINE